VWAKQQNSRKQPSWLALLSPIREKILGLKARFLAKNAGLPGRPKKIQNFP
jgi:hypothetical protein